MANADVDAVALGAAIRERRERRGWTVYRLAQRAGMSDPYLRGIEAGDSKRIGVSIVARIAHALGISTDDLLADIGLLPPPLSPVPADVAMLYSELEPPFQRAANRNLQTLRELQAAYRDDERQAAESPEGYAAFDEPETERIARQEAEPPPEDGP